MTLALKTVIGVFCLGPDLQENVLEKSALSAGKTVLDV